MGASSATTARRAQDEGGSPDLPESSRTKLTRSTWLRQCLFRDMNAPQAEALDYARIDRLTKAALVLHLVALGALATVNSVFGLGDRFPSPLAWHSISIPAAAFVLAIAAAATVLPLVVRRRSGNHYAWRVAATAALTTYSFLFIFVSGGAIEAHFHLFMVMAYVAAYADWRLQWVVAILTSLHHLLLVQVDATWVYAYGFNPLAPLVHAGSIVATAAFLTALSENHRQAVQGLSRTRITLERDLRERAKAQRELDATRKQLSAHEKLATMGGLVSGVAHEVRTPLTYVSNHLHLIRRRVDRIPREEPELRDLVEGIEASSDAAIEGVERINHLVGGLRRHTRLTAGARSRLSLQRVVEEATHLFAATHRGQVMLRTRLESTPEFLMDRIQIQQVVLNLLENAADVLAEGGTIEVTTRSVPQGAELSVRDNGPGIPETVQAQMFNPFFTTKTQGTGMGLAIVHRIVQDHGGRIACDTGPGRGTTFTVWLPVDGGA